MSLICCCIYMHIRLSHLSQQMHIILLHNQGLGSKQKANRVLSRESGTLVLFCSNSLFLFYQGPT